MIKRTFVKECARFVRCRHTEEQALFEGKEDDKIKALLEEEASREKQTQDIIRTFEAVPTAFPDMIISIACKDGRRRTIVYPTLCTSCRTMVERLADQVEGKYPPKKEKAGKTAQAK